MKQLEHYQIIKFPKILDRRGNLSFIEGENHLPFSIKRVYWIYDVPGGQVRGGHAFSEQCECIVALSGSFDVVLHDGLSVKTFSLNRSYYGLYVPPRIWRQMKNFSTNAVAMVMASTNYSESDYIRSFNEFAQEKNEKMQNSI